MTGKTVYVVRHGQTEWNVARRMQGRCDSPLTPLGAIQADVHGRTLARQADVETLIVSPLGRTRATAELLNNHLSLPVRFESSLMERNCGRWSGLTLEEIAQAYPDEWAARSDDPYHHRPPDGENLVDMEARVGTFIDQLIASAEGAVALVTHGVMSRVILKRLLDLSPQQAVAVRHPNELLYRLEVGAGRLSSTYFLQGHGPTPGLLRNNDSETIPRR